jgi:hypothetical protein
MKHSLSFIPSAILFVVIMLAFVACQSVTTPEEKAEPSPVAASADTDSIHIKYGIDLRGTGYVVFTGNRDTSFADLSGSIAYLKQLPDSLQRQHFYIVVDDNTDSSRVSGLRRMLPEAGVRDFEVLNIADFLRTKSEPLSQDLYMPAE